MNPDHDTSNAPEHDDLHGASVLRRLMADFRSGRLGAGVRIGLSLGAVFVCLAALFLILAMIEAARGRIAEEHIFTGIGAAGLVWVALLYRIWESYRQWRRVMRTAFTCIAMWIVAGGLCGLIASVRHQEELLIATVVFLALGLTVVVVTASIWDARRARALRTVAGEVRVHCPACGYSMAGLETSVCPECGHRSTLEALIAAQNYDRAAELSEGRAQDHSALLPALKGEPRAVRPG